jgi:hypothetical protein
MRESDQSPEASSTDASDDFQPSFEVTGIDSLRWPRHTGDDFQPSFEVTGIDSLRWPRHTD